MKLVRKIAHNRVIITFYNRVYAIIVSDPPVFIALVLTGLAIAAFGEILENVLEGDSHALDSLILMKMRDADNIESPWGPPWLEEMMRDITGLGGTAILTLVTFTAFFYLLTIRRRGQALYLLAAVATGVLLSNLIKSGIDRPRPDLVPHGSITYLPGFPSGHSLMTALVYLTLAVILAEIQPRRRLKVFIIAVAVLVVVLVGVSRVYLGVHWPSDVLAGWVVGTGWAILFWAIERYISPRKSSLSETAAAKDHRP